MTSFHGIPMMSRGVHLAPYFGEKGEMTIVAVTSQGRRVAERKLRPGRSPFSANAALWRALDKADPRGGTDGQA